MLAGHGNGHVRLWDLRSGELLLYSAYLFTFVGASCRLINAHAAWVSAVALCRTDENCLATASLDGNVRIWDLRSDEPLHTITDEGKIFSLVWDGKLAYGGESGVVHIANFE